MFLSRRQRFYVLEKIVLPLTFFFVHLWMKTWRLETANEDIIARLRQSGRVVIATFHGMMLQLLAFAPMAERSGVRLIVMTSPSYDGRLLAAFLRRFGINNVSGSSRSRKVGGSKELVRRVKEGYTGLIAVDGPRGPLGVAKPGVLKIAGAANAQLLLAMTSARPGITFGTWDRTHLPLPFAKVKLSLQLLPAPEKHDVDAALAKVQAMLIAAAREIGSPIVRQTRPNTPSESVRS